ncbi:hypothetical protein ACMD2_04722, partial [Ananas comosus]
MAEEAAGEGRRVGVAVDFSPCGKAALRWAAENLVRGGDHLVLVTVLKEALYEEGEMQLWEATGSRTQTLTLTPTLILAQTLTSLPLSLSLCLISKPLFDDLLHSSLSLSSLTPVLRRNAREKICEAINNIPLSCIVMGSRGLGKIK